MAVSWVWLDSEESLHCPSPVQIDRCSQVDGSVKYAVRQSGACLSKKGKWEYEPMPSSRTDSFLKRFRFDSFEDAAKAVEKFCKPAGRFAK